MEKIKKFIKENKYTILNVGCTMALTCISLDAVIKLDKCKKEIYFLQKACNNLNEENLLLIQELYEN